MIATVVHMVLSITSSIMPNRIAPLPVHTRRIRRVRARVDDRLAREFATLGLGGVLVERRGHARPVVVLDDDAVRDIVVERYFYTVLRVETQPLPAVDASATQVACRVAQAGVFHVHTTVLPVGRAL